MPRNGKAENRARATKSAEPVTMATAPNGALVAANGSAHEQSFELPILLDALEAMRQGDFSVRLPRGAAGIESIG